MSWVAIAAAGIGAAGSIGSSLISKGGSKGGAGQQQPDVPAWQLAANEKYMGWLSKYLDKYEPGKNYGGQRTAGMSDQEQQSMDWLQKYLDQPGTGENFGLAQDELRKTMTGEYDPYTSDYYKSLRRGSEFQTQDTIDKMRRGQGARGTYFQDTSMREEADVRLKGMNYLQQILGSLSEEERNKRYNAVPQLMNLEAYSQEDPLRKATAGQSLGALPRLIEQADYESKYKDFMRKQEELGQIPGLMGGAGGQRYSYGYPGSAYESDSPSSFERIMGIAGGVDWSGMFGNNKTPAKTNTKVPAQGTGWADNMLNNYRF